MDIISLEKKINLFLDSATDEIWFNRNNEKLFEYISAGRQSANHKIFKKIADAHNDHLLPSDFLDNNKNINLSVISFAFHFNKSIVKANSREIKFPAYPWYEIRYKFDEILPVFIAHIKELYHQYNLIVPQQTKLYSVCKKNNTLISNWSERHIAFACGLGSFGLNGALITDRGCTHRLLSIIIEKECPEKEIIEDDFYYNCLFFQKNECGTCVNRCPVRPSSSQSAGSA